jgi:predicted ATP-grasp superfamily ATP-dependent carboligase
MFTVGIYADQTGTVKGVFTGRKLRGYPADYGDCILGQNEVLPESLVEMVREFCLKLNYHGIAEFEFKQDARSQAFKLIEVNPRSWSWVGITPACGVSLPWMAYTDACGMEEAPELQCQLPTGTVKYVRLVNDWRNCRFRYKRNGFPQWSLSFKEWRRSLAADKLVIAEFGWRDFLPALITFFIEIKHMLLDRKTHKHI